MIKLISILSEIKLISKNSFPKNIEWTYKVNNKEEGINLLNKLKELGYKYWGNDETEINSYSKEYPNNIFDTYKFPIYISKVHDRKGIVWSNNNNSSYNTLKLNF